jgi:hypothetical protein
LDICEHFDRYPILACERNPGQSLYLQGFVYVHCAYLPDFDQSTPSPASWPQRRVLDLDPMAVTVMVASQDAAADLHASVISLRKSLSRASSRTWCVDKIAPTISDCGAV